MALRLPGLRLAIIPCGTVFIRATGRSPDKAFRDAQSALTVHFETLCEMGETLPGARGVEHHLETQPDDFSDGQWLLVDINMNQFDGRAERINITLPRRLLTKIDTFVRDHPQFSNRSAFLAEAARRVLTREQI